mgnify:CR=1 FL=1
MISNLCLNSINICAFFVIVWKRSTLNQPTVWAVDLVVSDELWVLDFLTDIIGTSFPLYFHNYAVYLKFFTNLEPWTWRTKDNKLNKSFFECLFKNKTLQRLWLVQEREQFKVIYYGWYFGKFVFKTFQSVRPIV